MTRKERYVHGQFSWVDLQSTDIDGSKTFYSELLGWEAQDNPTDQGTLYTIMLSHGASAAGMGPMSPAQKATGMPSVWTSYIHVDDLASTVAKAEGLGAKILMPPMKVMDRGSMALVQDTTGATFGLWQPKAHHGAGWVNSVGGFCWNELYTSDIDTSRAFYEGLFDWEFSVDKGPSGDYWSIKNQGEANGGMMALRPEWGEVPPNWSVYFTVASCRESVARAEALGAQVFMPPMTAPNVGTFAGLSDPQGASMLVIEISTGD